MPEYKLPQLKKPKKIAAKQVLLIASGDLRPSANRACWAAQNEMEQALRRAVKKCGYRLLRAHPYKRDEKHGFIGSQKEGLEIFRTIDPKAKLIVAEAVWQYSHHILHGLITHQGPLCTVANWSGTWPGLVGMLNLNGSLTKAAVKYSTLWSEDFTDQAFIDKLRVWLRTGQVTHPTRHVRPLRKVKVPAGARRLGQALAAQLQREQAIMGVFDEGCMGMFNAIIPDHLLNPTGVYKERLSQATLYFGATQVSDREARAVYNDLIKKGMTFNFGSAEKRDLTLNQVLWQCRTYIAALRIADEFGCDLIGIQYQQGLKDLLPASDLAEGLLNDAKRPPVKSADGKRILYKGQPLPHFNEVDECAGLDQLLIYRVHRAMGQPTESTLHDLRWGDWDQSGTTDEYVWVFEISGAVPPSHLDRGYRGAVGERQPPMYFRLGGSTIKGMCKPGEFVWSRIYIENGRLNLDIGRAKAIRLPRKETERRWQATTPQWPILHGVTYGVSRDQMMAKHKSNHLCVVYAKDEGSADEALLARAAMADALDIQVNVCGTRKDGRGWT